MIIASNIDMKKYFLCFLIAAFSWIGVPAQAPSPTPPDANAEKQRADRLQARLNDFANFARYRDANMKLSSPAKDEDRVVFMGDSITDSWKLAEYFPGKPYVNRGISGQTTSQMLIRFRPDVIDLRPKVVVILAGTNDIAGNTGPITLEAIEGNIASMVDLAHAHGIRVVLSSVLPVSDYNKNAQGGQIVRTVQRPPEKILALNDWMKKYSAERNLIYLDYYSASVDAQGFLKPDIANDGLHPNAKGYEIMKPLAEAAIAAALKRKQGAK
jgi:lysophospholipase L1-like esterase